MPKYDEPPAYRLVQRRDGTFNILARNDPDAAEAFASEAARKTGAHGRPCSNTRDSTAAE